ncbi:hypothetical protein KGQ24_02175, partial [Patescibacteria group bacterium]|nr:hypothetical protein [Patescibacteria group bacterium]
GGNGTEWDATHGSGGGGGGGNAKNVIGGAGGSYGAGGGGGDGAVAGGAGYQGIIVITYTPVVSTTIADGTNPSNATIGPGGAVTDLDAFTLAASAGTDTVTAATVTLGPTGAFNNIGQVDITNSGNTAQCTSITNPSSNSLSFTGCTIPVTTTVTAFKIRVTPKSASAMPAPPGASYATTGTVTAFTSTNAQAGTDTASATITIDNLSPADVTGASGTAGNGQVSFTWTNPSDSDYNSAVVLRSTSAVADTPVEGTIYSVGNTIGASTVACVVATPTASCTDTGVNNGTAYYYKIFTDDNFENYSTPGVVPTGSPFTPTAPAQTLTFSLGSNAINLGNLSSSSVVTGSHTMSLSTNASGGAVVTVSGSTLASGANTIAACATGCASSAGTQQFGINAVANTLPFVGASCSGTAPIAAAATNYNTTNTFRFVSGDTVVSSSGAINTTTCTISYITNISAITAAGSYSTALTYIITGNF